MAEVPHRFIELMSVITAKVAARPLNSDLARFLEDEFPANGPVFNEVSVLCTQGIKDGWLCAREAGGIKFGRPIKPGPATNGFSVDVVEMNEIVGPHHSHPKGEIDMIMPLDGKALFDGAPKGWKVYEPASAHRPTVSSGSALILYLLPDGAIEFIRE